MCHPSLRLSWRHICKSVQNTAERIAVWSKNKSINTVSEKNKTVISHEELILIYKCVEVKQRNHAWGRNPPATLFIFRTIFLPEPCWDFFLIIYLFILQKYNMLFLIGDIFDGFRGNVWCSFAPKFHFAGNGSCSFQVVYHLPTHQECTES